MRNDPSYAKQFEEEDSRDKNKATKVIGHMGGEANDRAGI